MSIDKLLGNINALKEHLEHDEGRKKGAYKDSKGLWTIAVGHLLSAEQTDRELEAMGLEDELDDWEGFEITDEQIDALLNIDIDDTLTMLKLSFTIDELTELNPDRFIALFSMAFQMGSVVKFPSMVNAIKSADWERAADEMLWSNGLKKQRRSQWYKDTPKRCQKMSDGIRWGNFDGQFKQPLPVVAASPLSAYSDADLIDELYQRLVKGV